MKYFHSLLITGFLIPLLPLSAELALTEATPMEFVEQREEASLTTLDEELSLLDEEFEEFKEELYSLENELQKKEKTSPVIANHPLTIEQSQEEVATFEQEDNNQIDPVAFETLLPELDPQRQISTEIVLPFLSENDLLPETSPRQAETPERIELSKAVSDAELFDEAFPIEKTALSGESQAEKASAVLNPEKNLTKKQAEATPAALNIEKTPLKNPFEEAPATLSIEKTPTKKQAEATPAALNIEKTPLKNPFEEAPATLSIEKTPTKRQAEATPATLNIERTPLKNPFEETPATFNSEESSAMEEPMPSTHEEIVIDLKQAFSGSPIIYALLLTMSVIAVSIWLYSLLSLRVSADISHSFIKNLQNKLNSNHFEEALSMCTEKDNLLCKMILSGIHSRRHGLPVMIEAMKAEGKRSSIAFWQKIGLLNDIAIIAPMLGLLGTVLGMFYAFYDVNRSIESISTLFDGLGISVGTTVAGLVVAILALILHSTAKYRLVRALALVENEAQSVATLIDDRTSIYKGP